MTSIETNPYTNEPLESELIVVLAPGDPLGETKQRVDREISRYGELEPVFENRELVGRYGKRIMEQRTAYFTVDGSKGALDEIVAILLKHRDVQGAYVKPKGAEPVVAAPAASKLNEFTELAQPYLGPAPDGIGATIARATPGSDGADIRITDCERNWNFKHEDITSTRHRDVLVGAPPTGKSHHGTGVAGIIAADATNAVGIVGIAPEAEVGGAAFKNGIATATTLDLAAKTLRAGDILLIEWDRMGPRGPHIPIEWWPDNLLAIQSAVTNGIIVVAAAGNGDENLDDPIYNKCPPNMTFPPQWANPFQRVNDSGAILVGAGAPPTGSHGPARSRIYDSNYGACVDVQGWGADVTTTGGGDLRRMNSTDINLWYTIGFNKTSAAAAMIAGVLASVQGARKKAFKRPWNSLEARRAVSNPAYGSAQYVPPGGMLKHIGPLPNLVELLKL